MKGSFVSKLNYLIDQKHITKNQLMTDLSLNKNQFHRWETGMNAPSRRTLQVLADYFLVTAESLSNPEQEIEYTYTATPITPDITLLPLSEQEKYILNLYREVSPTTQMRMAQAIMNLYDAEELS